MPKKTTDHSFPCGRAISELEQQLKSCRSKRILNLTCAAWIYALCPGAGRKESNAIYYLTQAMLEPHRKAKLWAKEAVDALRRP